MLDITSNNPVEILWIHIHQNMVTEHITKAADTLKDILPNISTGTKFLNLFINKEQLTPWKLQLQRNNHLLNQVIT